MTVEVARCPHASPLTGPGYGWVFRFGSIQLITCDRQPCFPVDEDRLRAVRMVAPEVTR